VRHTTRAEDPPTEPEPLRGPYSGSDRSSSVRLVLNGAVDDAVVHLAPHRRRRIEPSGLGDAILEAFDNAVDARLLAWAASPPGHAPQARHRQEGDTGAPSVTVPCTVPDDASGLHADIVLTPDELVSASLQGRRTLSTAEHDARIRTESPIVTHSSCRRVWVPQRGGGSPRSVSTGPGGPR
jgi:hypothetical protein